MLHPGWIFVVCLVLLAVTVWRLRWPLPIALIAVATIAALLAGFWNPARHLVEGGFGYLNLILSLFAGAFFGQAMRVTGTAEAVADWLHRRCGGRVALVALIAATLLFLVGMYVGVAGVAVLAAGVFAIPMLKRIGMADHRIAAFVAIIATCGMIAPPVNVPAMTIADGVNMPFADFAGPLLVLSLPPAIFALWYFMRDLPRKAAPAPQKSHGLELKLGLVCLVSMFGFWTLLRLFPTVIPDPAAPLVLVICGLIVLPTLRRESWSGLLRGAFGGTPLELAAVLVAIGVAVQIMALTGIRGWLVINAMSFPQPWTFFGLAGLPILGSVLTSIGTANVLGVPFAFAYIHQDMIVNVSALSALSALSEFAPPTAISTVLACYLVGNVSFGQVLRASVVPLVVLTAIALLVLIFARELAPFIVIRSA